MLFRSKMKRATKRGYNEALDLLNSEARNPGTLTPNALAEVRAQVAQILESIDGYQASLCSVYNITDRKGK